MKYAIIRDDGGIELREDSGVGLPPDSVALEDGDFDKIIAGTHEINNGKIVAIKGVAK